MDQFINELEQKIKNRKKMTSELYQIILSGKASNQLLKNFAIHRYPIKNFWTRNILGVASRIEDYELRCSLIENIYEEETGALTQSQRHLNTFIEFARSVGVTKGELLGSNLMKETQDVIDFNLSVCNSSVHFTAGVASVLLLMEGQPPILSDEGRSMEAVMRDVYKLPEYGYEFFTHHASNEGGDSVSDLEDEHAEAAKNILRKYCTTDELKNLCKDSLDTALELRHKHFDAILNSVGSNSEKPFVFAA